MPGSSEVLLGAMAVRGVEHDQPAFLGDAGQYPGFHDHLVARLARHPQEKPEDFQGRGEQKPLVGSNVMATGVCCLPGRLWSAMVSVCWLVGCALSFWRSLILIGLGKLLRYALVFLLASQIF